MGHPTLSDWTDFTRGLSDGHRRPALQEHLEDGCKRCRGVVNALEQVVTVAEIDGAITPSDGVVRSVRALFDLQRPAASSRWRELALQPTFDSARSPMVASRSVGRASRQMLFESAEYTLELSLDYSAGEADAVLRGQIFAARGGEPRSHTPVFLVGDGEVLARAISAEHGTFELSSRLDGSCELWAFPDDDNRIRLKLEH